MEGYWDAYLWLVIVGGILSFFMAWGIGANDVANAFGTSVGAKTLTLKQACLIAAVFEFSGAIGLGGEVTKTIAGSVARPTYYNAEPEVFAFGMVCALASAATAVAIATFFSRAVSTTHSIIGAVFGFTLVFGGADAVVWNDHIDEFPYSKGLLPVWLSWFISPVCGAILSSFLFVCTRFFILRRANSTTLTIWFFPVLVLITVFINLFFVLYKGAKNTLHWEAEKAAWVAACAGAGASMLAIVPGVPYLRWRLAKDKTEAAEAEAAKADKEAGLNNDANDLSAEEKPQSQFQKMVRVASKAMSRGLDVDIHKDVEHSQAIHDMHAAAEVFDPETERTFQYLQVFTACAVSFAHGANDVANAVGPFAGIYSVYKTHKMATTAESPYWILALGGAGIVVGLATYGYNIMATLGIGLAKFTPSRGYCAELGTSFVVVLASMYGLPVSTTQIITGAEVGVGLCENLKTGANWPLFGKQIIAWVIAFFASTAGSAAIFSFGAFAPSITANNDIAAYEYQLQTMTNNLYKALNATNFALQAAYTDKPFDAYLNATIVNNQKILKTIFDTKQSGWINPDELTQAMQNATALYMNYSTPITGFNKATRLLTGVNVSTLGGNSLSLQAFQAAQLKNK